MVVYVCLAGGVGHQRRGAAGRRRRDQVDFVGRRRKSRLLIYQKSEKLMPLMKSGVSWGLGEAASRWRRRFSSYRAQQSQRKR